MNKEFTELLKRVTFWAKASEEDKQLYIDHYMSEEEKEIGKPVFAMETAERRRFDVLCYNNLKGDLQGYDCPRCKNKGYIATYKDGYEIHMECKCMSIRRTIERMENSGLGNLLKLYKFDNFKQDEEWQKVTFNKAKAFLNAEQKWFYIGGQVGSGKTMLCTAIVREFLKQGMTVKYMLWNDESVELKQYVMDKEHYSPRMEELKNVEVLYIDDFFKTEKGANPSAADIKLAFEIINYRYNNARIDKNKKYITIISSERSLKELLDIDEAVASRIYEMANPDFCIYITPDMSKNYRLRSEI